uniref:Putative ovule protein n=1 Tax=Solanum chacoense TaxID=4108 RepID=A0A0V0GP19_SOLCH
MERVSLWMVWNQIAQKHIPHSIHVNLDEKSQNLQNDSGNQLEFGGPSAALDEEVGTYGGKEYICAFSPFIIWREVC